MALRLLRKGAPSEKRETVRIDMNEVAGVIRELKAWRERNDLSQKAAAELLASEGVPVLLGTLRRWEIGYRRPGVFAAKALAEFLARHPKVKGDGGYGSRARPPVSRGVLKRVKELRKEGKTLREIAEMVGISESGVSRICGGSRHGKEGAIKR
jgi:transcriptional regulator with XRE-family HTH domain